MVEKRAPSLPVEGSMLLLPCGGFAEIGGQDPPIESIFHPALGRSRSTWSLSILPHPPSWQWFRRRYSLYEYEYP